ncbi:MAG: molybdopterin-dependent oxidoreductase [Actinobacteria bacterium]|nr:molybdopterin-dependent oxidoreductase [Actinomycetota bacterium]
MSQWPEADNETPWRPDERRFSRRSLLGVGLGVTAAGGLGALVWQATSSQSTSSQSPTAIPQLDSSDEFEYYSVIEPVPVIAAADWTMTVGGLVGAASTLSMADLRGLPQTGLTRDFQCVTGWRVSQVPWSGVLVRDLLREVKSDSNAGALRITSFDGVYDESLTMDQAKRDDILIATSMYGKPVSHERGGPVRLLVAPMYGYKSLKWLGGVEVQAEVTPGYWERRGYDVDAWVGQSNGRTDEPT